MDHNPSNSSSENLAFLCLTHHDQYDSQTRQSKGLTASEVKLFRKELDEHVLMALKVGPVESVSAASDGLTPGTANLTSKQRLEIQQIVLEALDKLGPLRSLERLSRELDVSRRYLKGALLELAARGVVRVDRRPATAKRVYSLATARENLLLDTFIAQLHPKPRSEERFVRRGSNEVDAVIKGADGTTYVVETLMASDHVPYTLVERRLQQLGAAKQSFGMTTAVGVLLIGISAQTKGGDQRELKSLETPTSLIRFIELP